jgi:hypothetical protein
VLHDHSYFSSSDDDIDDYEEQHRHHHLHHLGSSDDMINEHYYDVPEVRVDLVWRSLYVFFRCLACAKESGSPYRR